MSAATRPDWATIPNLVTLLRFVLLAPVCVLLLDGPDTLAVVLLLVWASTDWVDGLLARLLDQTSRTGAIIDPIADRVGLAGIVLSLAIADLLSWAALAIIVLVDLAMAAWMPSLVPLAQVLFWIGVAMHTASGIDYILRARRAPADAPVAAEPPSPR